MIEYIDRKTNEIKHEPVPSGRIIKWLYNAPLGLLSLHLLMKRKFVNWLAGAYMNSRLSLKYLSNFINEYNIDLSKFILPENGKFKNFNEFFARELKAENKVIMNDFISPSDGKILAFERLSDIKSFYVKGSEFTLDRFTQDMELSKQYSNGSMMILRLAPIDYHRFHFPADAIAENIRFIRGKYFSVNPIALKQSIKIFLENRRCFNLLKSDNYGNILMSEVGATMVGSIKHLFTPNTHVKKGDEKGFFAFGGSTIILIFEEGKIKIDSDLLENTKRGYETFVRFGETIGS